MSLPLKAAKIHLEEACGVVPRPLWDAKIDLKRVSGRLGAPRWTRVPENASRRSFLRRPGIVPDPSRGLPGRLLTDSHSGRLEARFGIVPGQSGCFPRQPGDEFGASERMLDATSRVEACRTAT